MKPQIDARAPHSSGMKHLKINFKRDEMLGVRYDEIERDNRHLLQAMHRLAQEPGSAPPPSKSRSAPNLNSAFNFPGGPARRNEINRIEFENARLLKNLQNMSAEMCMKDSEASYNESRGYLRRICEYPPNMKLKRRVRPTASLEVLPGDDLSPQAGQDLGAVAQDPASPSGHGLRYVLKEHLIIAGGTYLVEMATDGQTLAISIYDSELHDTMELLVNEENHRRLLDEHDGDYSRIAARLRIRDDQLVIVPLEADEEAR